MNKEEQKKLITEIMNEDAKDGLYKPAKTAVEWLIEQLKEYDCADIKDSQNWVIKIDALVLTAKVEQAKAMEKEYKANIRRAIADYMYSEGCACCEGIDHKDHAETLAKLLDVPKYEDGSGYNFSQFRNK